MGGESFFTGFISFVAFMVSFLILLHLPVRIGWLTLEIATGVIVHILSSIFGLILIEGFTYWHQASLYAFLWFCFFFVSGIYSASVSIGIISYLYDQPRHTATLRDVYKNCIEYVFEQRVDFLVAQGLAHYTEKGYTSTPKGKQIVRQLQVINQTLGMESHGFYSSTSVLKESTDMTDE